MGEIRPKLNATILFIASGADDSEGRLVQAILEKDRHDRVIICDPTKQHPQTIVETEKPDVIIISSMIVGIDSRQLFRDLKAVPEIQDIPVLFWRVASKQLVSTIRQLGAAGFIGFYIQPEQLLEGRDIALSGGTYFPTW